MPRLRRRHGKGFALFSFAGAAAVRASRGHGSRAGRRREGRHSGFDPGVVGRGVAGHDWRCLEFRSTRMPVPPVP